MTVSFEEATVCHGSAVLICPAALAAEPRQVHRYMAPAEGARLEALVDQVCRSSALLGTRSDGAGEERVISDCHFRKQILNMIGNLE